MEKRCFGCMQPKTQSPVCEHCGFHEGTQNQPHQLPIGYLLQGRYLIGRVLGQGGFGITYLGYDENLALPVAVKEFFPTGAVTRDLTRRVNNVTGNDSFGRGLERFLREAKTLARLMDVPEIVKILNVFQENGTAYIVMECIEGLDLRTYLKRMGRVLTPEETMYLLRPVMQGLEKVHKEGLIHRDISPDNIMVQKTGRVKLLDFGTARDTGNTSPDGQLTHSTQAILKYGFAPMEQYQSRGSLGPWTDVYSLCATAYYCMTGHVPKEATERVLDQTPLPWDQIPGLPNSWISVLNQGMEVSPMSRIQSVGELEQLLFSGPVPNPPEPPKPIPPDPQPSPRRKWLPAAVAAALVLVIGVGVFAYTNAEKDQPEKSNPTVSASKGNAPKGSNPKGNTSKETTPKETVAQETIPAATQPKLDLSIDMFKKTTIAAGGYHSIALKDDGTVTTNGSNQSTQRNVYSWKDIVAVSAGGHHSVGLKKDGTVVATGRNKEGQCDVSDWTNIVAIAAGWNHTVGLKKDGTVVAAGANASGQCNVSSWKDIVYIAAGESHTVGLKKDGTVVAIGYKENKQCNVSAWSEIVKIAAGSYHTVGLKADGTVVAVGGNSYGQCAVSSWTGITDIFAGGHLTVALNQSGSVIPTKYTGPSSEDRGQHDLSGWSGIVSVTAGKRHTLGLKKDGSAVAAGPGGSLCYVGQMVDLRIPKKN